MKKDESQKIWENYTNQDETVKEGTWHIGTHKSAQIFYKYILDNADTYMAAAKQVEEWKESWYDKLLDIGGEAFGDDNLYDNIYEFIQNPSEKSLHELRRSSEVALGLTKRRERENREQGV